MKKKKAICITCRTIFPLGKQFVEVYGMKDGMYASMCETCKDDLEPAPEDGGCMYNHDHKAEPDMCERHD